MPTNRPLGEYIVILNLLGRLLARLDAQLNLGTVKKSHTSTTIGLLASFSRIDNQLFSRAVIGFSLTGSGKKRQRIIKQRRKNLPQLNEIDTHGLNWSPGNCAECETFAYYNYLYESLKNKCGQFKIVTVSLALNILQGFPVPFCAQCSQLARIVVIENRDEIIDLVS